MSLACFTCLEIKDTCLICLKDIQCKVCGRRFQSNAILKHLGSRGQTCWEKYSEHELNELFEKSKKRLNRNKQLWEQDHKEERAKKHFDNHKAQNERFDRICIGSDSKRSLLREIEHSKFDIRLNFMGLEGFREDIEEIRRKGKDLKELDKSIKLSESCNY